MEVSAVRPFLESKFLALNPSEVLNDIDERSFCSFFLDAFAAALFALFELWPLFLF
jgi:hypothetical protein